MGCLVCTFSYGFPHYSEANAAAQTKCVYFPFADDLQKAETFLPTLGYGAFFSNYAFFFFFFGLFNSFSLFPFNMQLQSQAPRALYLVASLSFPAFFLLRRSLIPAALISPILPCSKVCTSLTPAASQGSHYITAGLPASSPGSHPRPLLATIHTVT